MKSFITTLISLFVVTFSAQAQTPVTQVVGFLEVYHPLDTSSLYIGLDAGQQSSGNFRRNTFVGFGVGRENTTGSRNSFFGVSSGFSNTTGNNNSFFGVSSGLSNTTGSRNSFYGDESGRANTTGADNSFFGSESGDSNTTGAENSFFGSESGLSNTTGSNNSFFGWESGGSNTTGDNNSFFGSESGDSNTTGRSNSFFGEDSGRSNTTGGGNSFFGEDSGRDNTTGGSNSFFGEESGDSNTTGGGNSFFGEDSGRDNTTGSSNSFFGEDSGRDNTTGGSNSFFGEESGRSNTEGTDNSFFGISAGDSITTQSRVIAIGAHAGPTADSAKSDRLYIDVTSTDDPLIYGEFDNDLLRVNGTLQLGGQNYFGGDDDGVIRSPRGGGSDIFLVANDAVTIEIGDVMNQAGTFEIWNGGLPNLLSTAADNFVFKVDESGNVITKGNISTVSGATTGTITGMINNVSDINRKETFAPINTKDILDKITHLPITEWQYKGTSGRHIGPMAQDFYAAFGLGQGETTIATVDADGVALAAIQALAKKNEKLEKTNQRLEKENQLQEESISNLKDRLARLEAMILEK